VIALKAKRCLAKNEDWIRGRSRRRPFSAQDAFFTPHFFATTGLPVQAIDSAATNQNWIECPPAIAA
jgi:hypothetical protein